MENTIETAKKKFLFETSKRREENKVLAKMKAKLLEKKHKRFYKNDDNSNSSESILEISYS